MPFAHLIVFLLMFGFLDAANAKDVPAAPQSSVQQSSRKETHFRKASWGMSEQQVRASESATYVASNDIELLYRGEVAGMPANICYFFQKGALIGGTYVLIPMHLNNNQYIEDYATIKEILRKQYGKPGKDETKWKDNLFKDDPNYRGTAVVMGELVLSASWETEASEILLVLSRDNLGVKLVAELWRKNSEIHNRN